MEARSFRPGHVIRYFEIFTARVAQRLRDHMDWKCIQLYLLLSSHHQSLHKRYPWKNHTKIKGPRDNGEDLPGRLLIHFAQHPKHPYFYFICFVDCQHQLFKFRLRLLEDPWSTLALSTSRSFVGLFKNSQISAHKTYHAWICQHKSQRSKDARKATLFSTFTHPFFYSLHFFSSVGKFVVASTLCTSFHDFLVECKMGMLCILYAVFHAFLHAPIPHCFGGFHRKGCRLGGHLKQIAWPLNGKGKIGKDSSKNPTFSSFKKFIYNN